MEEDGEEVSVEDGEVDGAEEDGVEVVGEEEGVAEDSGDKNDLCMLVGSYFVNLSIGFVCLEFKGCCLDDQRLRRFKVVICLKIFSSVRLHHLLNAICAITFYLPPSSF